jgi:hypothetical protein
MECDLNEESVNYLKEAITQFMLDVGEIPRGVEYLLELLEEYDGTIHCSKVR